MTGDQPSGTAEADQLRELVRVLNARLDASMSPVGQAQTQHVVAWYDYQRTLMTYSKAMLDWQLFASNVLLWVVVLVAAAGVVFSGVQLAIAARAGLGLTTGLDVSAQKVRLTSSVVGVVILVISIAFLLVFVQQVYQIKAVDLQFQPTISEHEAGRR